MPKYVIEREMPGAAQLTTNQLKDIAQNSMGALSKLGAQVQWVDSQVTDNKIYCTYIAPSEHLIREHAKLGGFPANSIRQVFATIDPTTAE
ncbi:MAG: hypothetical protein ACI9OE_002749 [Mariniflexile sp.]|jgi:hypothetical protein